MKNFASFFCGPIPEIRDTYWSSVVLRNDRVVHNLHNNLCYVVETTKTYCCFHYLLSLSFCHEKAGFLLFVTESCVFLFLLLTIELRLLLCSLTFAITVSVSVFIRIDVSLGMQESCSFYPGHLHSAIP